jgi:restriction system protein
VPEITKRRVGELIRGLFKILAANPEGLPAKAALEQLAISVPPTEFENSTYPKHPNTRRFEKIVRFSTVTVAKAGWMTKDRGLWAITEEGKQALWTLTDPVAFSTQASKLYRQWKRNRPEPETEIIEEEAAETATTLEEAEESAWGEIENHLSTMSPYDFQDLVAGLLRGMGYHVLWVAPPGPDKGIDIIGHSDPLGIRGPRIKVQVKRMGDKIAVQGLRSFMAMLGEEDAGLFVCTGGFTKDAEGEARNQEKRRLMLVDSRRLFDLWVENYNNIPEVQRQLLPIRPVYFLLPRQ